MRFKIVIIIILGFLNIKCHKGESKRILQPHGTLLIAVICTDGIIIASDSRGSFTEPMENGKQHVFAYMDGCQKIFKIKDYNVAVSGITMFNGQDLFQLAKQFNKTKILNRSFIQIFDLFKSFILKKYNITDNMLFQENRFITGFYDNGKANLVGIINEVPIVFNDGKPRIMFSNGSSEAIFYEILRAYKAPFTCKHVAMVVEKTIYKFAADSGLTEQIGGPIEIIKIDTNNKMSEIKSFHYNQYKDYKDFSNYILNSKIKLTYTDSNGKEKVKLAIDQQLKYWY